MLRLSLRFATTLAALLAAPVAAQVPSPTTSAAPPSRIARIVVTPVQKVVTAGDSLRFTAEARDTQNAVIPGVQFRWSRESGARFEGRVDESGLLLGVRVLAHLACDSLEAQP